MRHTGVHLYWDLHNCKLQSLLTLMRVVIISCVPLSAWHIQEYTYTETFMTVSFSRYWRWWGLSSFHVSVHQPETYMSTPIPRLLQLQHWWGLSLFHMSLPQPEIYRNTPILGPLRLLASVLIAIDDGCHHSMCPSINLKPSVHFLTPRPLNP